MDFTALLAVVDTTTILAGIASIAALKFGPTVARWGFGQVMKFIKG